MPVSAHACAFAPQFVFIPQSDMDHPAFPAVHGIKTEWLPGVFYFFRCRSGRQAKLCDPKHPVIIRVKGKA